MAGSRGDSLEVFRIPSLEVGGHRHRNPRGDASDRCQHLLRGDPLTVGTAERRGHRAARGRDRGKSGALHYERAGDVPDVHENERLLRVVQGEKLLGEDALPGPVHWLLRSSFARRHHPEKDPFGPVVAREVPNGIPCLLCSPAVRPPKHPMAQITKIESGPDRRGRLGHVLQARGPSPDVEGPMLLDHREALVYTLGKAAELEHLVLCQYLFAAFSLKQGEREGLSTEQAELVKRWRHGLMDIAEQEMLHLAQVQNRLNAVSDD